MSISFGSLWGEVQLGNTATLLYASPVNIATSIRKAVFTNIDTSARTFTVYIVPSGGSPATSNTIISALSLLPGQSYIASELSGLVLTTGVSIQALSDSASKINTIGSGFTL